MLSLYPDSGPNLVRNQGQQAIDGKHYLPFRLHTGVAGRALACKTNCAMVMIAFLQVQTFEDTDNSYLRARRSNLRW